MVGRYRAGSGRAVTWVLDRPTQRLFRLQTVRGSFRLCTDHLSGRENGHGEGAAPEFGFTCGASRR